MIKLRKFLFLLYFSFLAGLPALSGCSKKQAIKSPSTDSTPAAQLEISPVNTTRDAALKRDDEQRKAAYAYTLSNCDGEVRWVSIKMVCEKDGELQFEAEPVMSGSFSSPGVSEVLLLITDTINRMPGEGYQFGQLMRWNGDNFNQGITLTEKQMDKNVTLPPLEGDSIEILGRFNRPDNTDVLVVCTSFSFHGEFQQNCFPWCVNQGPQDFYFEFSDNAALAAMPGDTYVTKKLTSHQEKLFDDSSGLITINATYTKGHIEEDETRHTDKQEEYTFKIKFKDGILTTTIPAPFTGNQ
ncbi:MAG: hypothetical protein JXR91_03805 [Deltaproteobacteria bacterium]|nr:hypothetical protein [Deltaproteobacteria bacterium]